jgi:type II secretory pathway predicted ATPase ExeA
MVRDFYNLREEPFGVTPDPRFLYMSPSHREALASLLYGIQSGRGFMSLIAQPGMGKTTILFELLNQLDVSAKTVFLFQTLCQPKDLLRDLLRDLDVAVDSEDMGPMQQQLNQALVREARQGRRVVVIIDEAQGLEDSALELLRMLSNFETTNQKLMQVILAGQPQLRERLASPHFIQLRQRVSICSRLHPLSLAETELYLAHRLQIAGYQRMTPLFTPEATALIVTYSEGIPRTINNICFNALALGFVSKKKTIGEDIVRESLHDLDLGTDAPYSTEREPGSDIPLPIEAARFVIPEPVISEQRSWLKRAMICLVLLVPLLWFSSDGKGAAAVSLKPLLSSQPQTSAAQLTPPGTADPLDSGFAANLSQSQRPGTAASTNAVRGTHASPNPALEPTPDKKPPKAESGLEEINDPSKLWAAVKRQSTDAEVALARLYLQGSVVPRSCEQAQILLQAASRKGNVRATDMLRTYGDQCP